MAARRYRSKAELLSALRAECQRKYEATWSSREERTRPGPDAGNVAQKGLSWERRPRVFLDLGDASVEYRGDIERARHDDERRASLAFAQLQKGAAAVLEWAKTRRRRRGGPYALVVGAIVTEHHDALEAIASRAVEFPPPSGDFNLLRRLLDGLDRRSSNAYWSPVERLANPGTATATKASGARSRGTTSRSGRKVAPSLEPRTAYQGMTTGDIAVIYALEDDGSNLAFEPDMTVAEALQAYRRLVAEALRRASRRSASTSGK